MALLNRPKRLLIEDFPTEQEWIGKLLLALNDFQEGIYFALQQDLTVGDNLRGEFRNIVVTGGNFPITFTTNTIGTIQGVFVADIIENVQNPSVITNAVTIDWEQNSGTIIVNNITGLSGGVDYKVRLLILG